MRALRASPFLDHRNCVAAAWRRIRRTAVYFDLPSARTSVCLQSGPQTRPRLLAQHIEARRYRALRSLWATKTAEDRHERFHELDGLQIMHRSNRPGTHTAMSFRFQITSCRLQHVAPFASPRREEGGSDLKDGQNPSSCVCISHLRRCRGSAERTGASSPAARPRRWRGRPWRWPWRGGGGALRREVRRLSRHGRVRWACRQPVRSKSARALGRRSPYAHHQSRTARCGNAGVQ